MLSRSSFIVHHSSFILHPSHPMPNRNPKPDTRKPSKRQFVRLGPPPADTPADAVTIRVGEKPKREKKPRAKHDPKLVAAARELRDRWLERVNADPSMLVSSAKYDVSRSLEAIAPGAATPLLPAPKVE
jgi:hypothetical protein